MSEFFCLDCGKWKDESLKRKHKTRKQYVCSSCEARAESNASKNPAGVMINGKLTRFTKLHQKHAASNARTKQYANGEAGKYFSKIDKD